MSVRTDLQHGRSPELRNRRIIVGLSLFSNAVLSAIALFQVGVLKKLPTADKVNGSRDAYALLKTPDALLGMASYAATSLLAGAGAANRFENEPLLPLAMACKMSADAALAGSMAVKQWTRFRSFSVWSLLVSGATIAALPFALGEAKKALATVRRR